MRFEEAAEERTPYAITFRYYLLAILCLSACAFLSCCVRVGYEHLRPVGKSMYSFTNHQDLAYTLLAVYSPTLLLTIATGILMLRFRRALMREGDLQADAGCFTYGCVLLLLLLLVRFSASFVAYFD